MEKLFWPTCFNRPAQPALTPPTKRGGTIRFLTKFIVAGAQYEWALTYQMDFEADAPEHAGELARDYWCRSWQGPEIVTEAVIRVYRHLPNSQGIDETPAFVVSLTKSKKDD
jgi:hypothetical protein